mmetsp:Transcript_91938/g.165995  ORF Transcript_91938/g.165995 Transcript_91938/m.165995 type:complete len:264 (-) Transcript_91938:505-1296(-)
MRRRNLNQSSSRDPFKGGAVSGQIIVAYSMPTSCSLHHSCKFLAAHQAEELILVFSRIKLAPFPAICCEFPPLGIRFRAGFSTIGPPLLCTSTTPKSLPLLPLSEAMLLRKLFGDQRSHDLHGRSQHLADHLIWRFLLFELRRRRWRRGVTSWSCRNYCGLLLQAFEDALLHLGSLCCPIPRGCWDILHSLVGHRLRLQLELLIRSWRQKSTTWFHRSVCASCSYGLNILPCLGLGAVCPVASGCFRRWTCPLRTQSTSRYSS